MATFDVSRAVADKTRRKEILMAVRGGRPTARVFVPNLIVRNVDEAIEFYQPAFDAKVLHRSALPDGRALHAQARIFDSVVLLSLENMGADEETWSKSEVGLRTRSPETLRGSTSVLEVYVDDVGSAYQRAIDCGATPEIQVMDFFYGDRGCQVVDPFGHVWGLSTAKEILDPAVVDERARQLFGSFARG